MTPDSPLLDGLPVEQRLALAYAPVAARGLFAGLFALDTRLAGIVRAAREPMLAQLRLAWWRDRLGEGGGGADPVLIALAPVLQQGPALVAAADGWEALLGETLNHAAAETFAAGRAAGMAAMAQALGCPAAEAERAGRNWALADLAARVSNPAERAVVLDLIATQDWGRPALPRSMRPLAVLHGLARRQRGARPLIEGPVSLLCAIRLGLTGR
ncbi:hypothetical protein [Novosphingobium sp. B 225]|uniref:hypothetical protein n=1 Tax=Novosphingobium sp. B 225 TaxID=1961849 RepID=UPI000B4AADF6|nr:hypothetical protein [Novosphingobium sp. B 225]